MSDDALLVGVRRWRVVLAASLATLALLVAASFVTERAATRATVSTGTALRAATAAQRSAWEAEAAVRAIILGGADPSPARVRAEQDSVRSQLVALRTALRGNRAQLQRVDVLERALTEWDRTFATPAIETGTLTLGLARAGTLAFDKVSAQFDAIIEEESRIRRVRIARQSQLAWGAFLLSALAFATVGVTARRVLGALEREAEQAIERQERIEEQAVELEQQTTVLEEQAAQLEEQSAALKARVAERDETNRLLRQTTLFLDSALDSAPVGIGFYDRALRFQRLNGALATINGLPAEEHLGRRLEEVIPELAPTIRPVLERVLQTGRPEEGVIIEGTTPAAPGRLRRWLCTYYPIQQRGEAPVGVGCMVIDVTEQHRLEQQLRQAQKLEAVGRLAGGIAHDFNNVLTVIQSYAEVLAFELGERDRNREEVDAIRGAADRATALARQLLAFSRRDVIIPRDLDVREVVRGLELILRRLVRQNVDLALDLGDETVVVRVDSGQLEQVIMNLAINAVDAMPDGGRVTITTRRLPATATTPARALLRIEDTGTGMEPAVLDRLFEPFFTTKPAGRGTGLGLATAYAIVQEAGGAIAVESTLGVGSRFDVTLPLSDASDADAAKRLSPVEGISTAKGNEVILLAEDEPAIRTALSRILHGSGYRVLEASNGGEALRIAGSESGEIHLLLTDVMMPGIGGRELVERLSADRPHTKVIMMSGYTDDAELRAALGAARFTFLQKPFAARQVLAAVRAALDA